MTYEAERFYITDKAYVDFKQLFTINKSKAFYVTRAKKNFNFERISSLKPDKINGIICDQTVKLNKIKSSTYYPVVSRRIKYFDKEHHRTFVFLTNNFTQTAVDIAMLYKYRREVKLF